MAKHLTTIKIEPKIPAKASMIWLHGLGATAEDLMPIIPQLRLPEELAIRYIFPQAPTRAITLNNGYHMPGWYDILGLNRKAQQDEVGIHESENAIIQLIEAEIDSGIDPKNIILAGFSQGGVMALQTALRYPKRLAGILVLSGYLVLAEKLAAEKTLINQDIPILWAHGEDDTVVSLSLAKDGIQCLQENSYQVEQQFYPMEHSICWQEINDIANWIHKIFNNRSS